jgi:hypothetical protein
MDMEMKDPGRQVSPAARKKTNKSTKPGATIQDEEAKRRGPTSEAAGKTTARRYYGENLFVLDISRIPRGKSCERVSAKRVDSYSKRVVEVSSGLIHLAREMYGDVTHTETVEIPDEFFDKTLFVT